MLCKQYGNKTSLHRMNDWSPRSLWLWISQTNPGAATYRVAKNTALKDRLYSRVKRQRCLPVLNKHSVWLPDTASWAVCHGSNKVCMIGWAGFQSTVVTVGSMQFVFHKAAAFFVQRKFRILVLNVCGFLHIPYVVTFVSPRFRGIPWAKMSRWQMHPQWLSSGLWHESRSTARFLQLQWCSCAGGCANIRNLIVSS